VRNRIGNVAVVALVLVLALGACGGKKKSSAPAGDDASATTVAGGAPTTVATTPTTLPPCPEKPEPTGPLTQAGAVGGAMFTNVRRDGDRCVDLVIFSFASTSKDEVGYTAEYATGPFVDSASGEPVNVSGNAFIRIKFQPAYGYDPETGQATYDGPRVFTPAGGTHVTQLGETESYEGVVAWVIGLDEKRPFTVKSVPGPDPEVAVEIS